MAVLALGATAAAFGAPKDFKGNSGNGNASNGNNFTDLNGNTSHNPPGQNDRVKVDKTLDATGALIPLTIDTAQTWGSLEFIGGKINGAQSLTLSDNNTASSWTGGEFSATTFNLLGLTIGSGGTDAKKITGGGKVKLGGNTAWNADTITIDGGTLENNSGATFTTNFDGTIANANGSTFSNFGTFEKTGGNGTGTTIATTFTNTGTVKATTGTLKLTGGGKSSGAGNTVNVGASGKLRVELNDYTFEGTTLAGTGTIEAAGAIAKFKAASGTTKLDVIGGTADFDTSASTTGALTFSSGTITSTNGGSATVDSLAWTGGNLNGKVTTTNGGTISGGNGKTLGAGADVTLKGTTTWDGSTLATSSSAKLKNDTGATFNAADGTITSDGSTTFTNAGTFRKSSGTGTTTINAAFDSTSTGTVAVDDNRGRLKLTGGGKSSNAVSVGANAALEISGADFAFANSAVSGTGTIDLTGATTTFKNTTGSAKISLNGGNAKIDGSHNGTGKLVLASGKLEGINAAAATFGSLDWAAGEITALTLYANGTTITAGGKSLTGGAKLKLAGVTTWSASDIATSDSAEITNDGTFLALLAGSITHGAGTRGTFRNNGTFNKSGDAGTVDVQTLFDNAGTASVASGKLKLSGGAKGAAGSIFDVGTGAELEIVNGLTLDALSQLKGGGAARLTSGVLTANGSVDVARFEFDAGELAGSQAFKGILNWNGGHWNATATGFTTTIDAGGVLNLNGGAHDFNYRTIVNNGTVNWKAGNLRGGNGSSFLNANAFFDLNAGTKTLQAPAGFGGTFTFTNNGVYNKTGGGTTIVEVNFTNNNGAVFVNSGTLHFKSTFHQTAGTLMVGAGATAQFDQDLNFAAGTLTGAGTIQGNVSNAGVISPGSSPGTLNIVGDLTLISTSVLLIELGGTTPGLGYDVIAVTGNTAAAGVLSVSFVNGFLNSVQAGDVFTVLTAGAGFNGSFTNVANGGRLITTDGIGSFQVNYGAAHAFGAQSVVLSNFVAVPEPSTYALLGLGALAVLAAALQRRKTR